LCIPLVVSRFDVNALRWARGGATKARNTAGRAIFTLGKPMNSPESFRIRTPLLGVRDGVDPIADRLERRIVARPKGHIFDIAQSVAHRFPQTLYDLGDVSLHRCRTHGSSHNPALHLAGPETFCVLGSLCCLRFHASHASIFASRV